MGDIFEMGDIWETLWGTTIYGMASDVIKRFDWLISVQGKFGGKNDSGIPEMEYRNQQVETVGKKVYEKERENLHCILLKINLRRGFSLKQILRDIRITNRCISMTSQSSIAMVTVGINIVPKYLGKQDRELGKFDEIFQWNYDENYVK